MPELEHVSDLDGWRDVGNAEVVDRAAVNADWYPDDAWIVAADEGALVARKPRLMRPPRSPKD